jgi:hypothetical protein
MKKFLFLILPLVFVFVSPAQVSGVRLQCYPIYLPTFQSPDNHDFNCPIEVCFHQTVTCPEVCSNSGIFGYDQCFTITPGATGQTLCFYEAYGPNPQCCSVTTSSITIRNTYTNEMYTITNPSHLAMVLSAFQGGGSGVALAYFTYDCNGEPANYTVTLDGLGGAQITH